MFKEDGIEQFLIDMSANRGDGLAIKKAETSEQYVEYEKERKEAFERLSKDFSDDQKKILTEYEEALLAIEGVIHHYIYLQGLKDGIALGNVI